MQTNQKSEQLFVEKESINSKNSLNDQLQRKADVQQRITAYLNLFRDNLDS